MWHWCLPQRRRSTLWDPSVCSKVFDKSLILGYPKEKIQGIERRRTWTLSNGFDASNPPPWICDIEGVTTSRGKCPRTSSCINHMPRCSVASTLCSNSGWACCSETWYFTPFRISGRSYALTHNRWVFLLTRLRWTSVEFSAGYLHGDFSLTTCVNSGCWKYLRE